jgi:prevent-host-death family protein
MRFISTRELRNEPAKFRRSLSEDEVVLTTNGKPFAVVVSVTEADLEDTLASFRRARLQRTVRELQRQARAAGVDQMTAEEIDAEIAASRAERRRKT